MRQPPLVFPVPPPNRLIINQLRNFILKSADDAAVCRRDACCQLSIMETVDLIKNSYRPRRGLILLTPHKRSAMWGVRERMLNTNMCNQILKK